MDFTAAADQSRSRGAIAESLIGNMISITSKSEIRYEGTFYNIDTVECNIGLRNVRSFGTEGRKKEGPQLPASDKVYDYILFRGSNIKDLQVMSSPRVQPTPYIHHDPAIIQSHYPRSASTSTTTSMPSVANSPLSDISSHVGHVRVPNTIFQGSLPLYQHWPGFYAPGATFPSGLTNLHQQQALLHSQPCVSMPPHFLQHPWQYPGINASLSALPQNMSGSNASLSALPQNMPGPNASLPVGHNSPFPSRSSTLPEISSSLVTPINAISSLSLSVGPTQANTLSPEISMNMPPNNSVISLPVTTLPFVSTSTPKVESISVPIDTNPVTIPGPNFPDHAFSHPATSAIELPNSRQVKASMYSLVASGQPLQSGPSAVSSFHSLQPVLKEMEDKSKEPEFKASIWEPYQPSPAIINEPILPLPTPLVQKPHGAAQHYYHNYRDRPRGRGRGRGRERENEWDTKFTEEFDFSAMNEKFNKHEVWGNLGKSQGQLGEGTANEECSHDSFKDCEEGGPSNIEVQSSTYVKDNFFDNLSSESLNRSGRSNYSERLKLDIETFGEVPSQRPTNWGGRGNQGGQIRHPFNGRGGYGNTGRGWGFGRGPPPFN